ncbi:hypothetical protein BAUCODRAFT_61415 [Baudoinia panamericana UAMH 10762]|uniref:Complex 1 LYR protein domain-containing protein n=1 Tax=Baudoinia panamericana (strain UAMH 10762) TaxID=717646 RepID=M2N9R2_BAUPA|nr:uncharacterized protein BAUCODRAFT_61415 [Baudoinia panamericana UAMH 10762]EMD00939.1 hypothetical protein BAUCODRAFT_61415 [Baudoinia panamericana UAMH 10762]
MQDRHELVQAYRQLYKQALRACQYSKPSRYVMRDRIRNAFRHGRSEEFDKGKVERTVMFLRHAASHRGLEHTIQKNLCHVWWERENKVREHGDRRSCVLSGFIRRSDIRELRKHAYAEFDRTIERLNESMGLCIK